MKTYLVGGAVRDKLLGLSSTEFDWVVVGATPEDLLQRGFLPVGKDFPVFLDPKTHDEYALARTERKTGRGYAGFTFYATPDVTLEQDLQRRDLTINAMAMTDSGEIIDPYHGQRDLKDKWLRHVSDAFLEDPVRILRVARFYARFHRLGFRIAPETVAFMRAMVRNGEVHHLVSERVWQELFKALNEINPEKFFEALRACDALKVLFPEIENLYGVPNPAKWHPEIDTGIHVMMVLQQAAKLTVDPKVRFAALLHDLGKGVTPMSLWPKHSGHEQAGLPLIKAFCKRLRVPKEYAELALLVSEFHGQVHDAHQLTPATIIKLLERTDAFRRPQRFQEFLIACEADFRGRPGFENSEYTQSRYLFAAFELAKSVSLAPLLEKGLEGEKLKQAIHQARITSLKVKS